MGQETLDLGAEHQGARLGVLVVVHRLDAKVVPGQQQRLCPGIPQSKGEHAPQPVQHFLAPLLIAVEQHLGVAAGGKGVPGGQKLLPQFLEVVHLAVKDHHQGAVLVEHGLLAALQVNDGQTAVAQGDLPIHKAAFAVGTAVNDAVHHGL